jgi:DnaJ-class molecular chaperone
MSEKLHTVIECETCHGKGKDTKGHRCLDCNGTGIRECLE